MKEPRYVVDARALETAIIERGYSIEHFRRATRIHPATMARLLDPEARRDFRVATLRLLLKHLKIDAQKIIVDELSEEDIKALRYHPKATKKNFSLAKMYEWEAGDKVTWRPDRARRRTPYGRNPLSKYAKRRKRRLERTLLAANPHPYVHYRRYKQRPCVQT